MAVKIKTMAKSTMTKSTLLCILYLSIAISSQCIHQVAGFVPRFISSPGLSACTHHEPQIVQGTAIVSQHQQHRHSNHLISLNNNNSPSDDTGSNDIIEEDTATTSPLSAFNDDPDGIPLFDTNERPATLFGLEPNAELDYSMDNGLQFTGPVILFFSMYITLSLFGVFGDALPPLDLSM